MKNSHCRAHLPKTNRSIAVAVSGYTTDKDLQVSQITLNNPNLEPNVYFTASNHWHWGEAVSFSSYPANFLTLLCESHHTVKDYNREIAFPLQ